MRCRFYIDFESFTNAGTQLYTVADSVDMEPNPPLTQPTPPTAHSPWHQALVEWKEACRAAGSPCLHVDFHGKLDPRPKKGRRIRTFKLDLGIGP